MASKVTQSEFMANYGEIKGTDVADKLKEPPKTGIIRLPGGIENGILKLKECYFGNNENGDFFRCSGTVIAPESVGANGSLVPIRGLQSSQVVSFKPDTWDKKDKHGVSPKDEVINYMRSLVGDGPFKAERINLLNIAEMIQQRANDASKKPIYVRFSTSQSKPSEKYPNPRVFENWHGTSGLENYSPVSTGNPAPGLKEQPKSEAKAEGKKETPKKEEPKEPEKPVEYSDDQDLSSLATRAANGDSEAESTLREMFTKLGYTDDDWDGTTSFDQIVEIIRGGAKEGEGNGDDKEAPEKKTERIPVPGETVCKYAPPDARSKVGKRLKQVDCSVEKIDKRSKTMLLKALDSDKSFPDVKWNDEHVTYDD